MAGRRAGHGRGTGGAQVSADCCTPEDILKEIGRGADDTTKAVSIARFFEKTAGVLTAGHMGAARVIQARHRVPGEPLTGGRILVCQAPIPEPPRFLEQRETETRKMHALGEAGRMHVKLSEASPAVGQSSPPTSTR